MLRGIGANRYWEGRYRDEAKHNEKLREALQEIADDIVNNYEHAGVIARRALEGRVEWSIP